MYNNPNAQSPYGQPPYNSSYEQQYTQQPQYMEQPQYPPTQYGAPPMQPVPPVYIAPPPQNNSNKTLWIVLGVIGGILLLVGGGCCTASYIVGRGVSTQIQKVSTQVVAQSTADQQTAIAGEAAPLQQAQGYYQAITTGDYAMAFGYLAPNVTGADGSTLTQSTFTQQAQQVDSANGAVTSFQATADPNDATKITVQVTRNGGKTYTVHLVFSQGDFQWEISSFDAI